MTRRKVAPAAPAPLLDPQEFEIAVLVADGYGDRHIAGLLWLRPAEVLAIDLRIRHKLGARSREDVRRLLAAGEHAGGTP